MWSTWVPVPCVPACNFLQTARCGLLRRPAGDAFLTPAGPRLPRAAQAQESGIPWTMYVPGLLTSVVTNSSCRRNATQATRALCYTVASARTASPPRQFGDVKPNKLFGALRLLLLRIPFSGPRATATCASSMQARSLDKITNYLY